MHACPDAARAITYNFTVIRNFIMSVIIQDKLAVVFPASPRPPPPRNVCFRFIPVMKISAAGRICPALLTPSRQKIPGLDPPFRRRNYSVWRSNERTSTRARVPANSRLPWIRNMYAELTRQLNTLRATIRANVIERLLFESNKESFYHVFTMFSEQFVTEVANWRLPPLFWSLGPSPPL